MLRVEPDPPPSPPSRWLKSTEWLGEHLHDRDVVVVDGSFPRATAAQKRDVHADYLAAHIPGAVFFDIDAVADHSTELPHMLPSAEDFAAAVSAFGIEETDHI